LSTPHSDCLSAYGNPPFLGGSRSNRCWPEHRRMVFFSPLSAFRSGAGRLVEPHATCSYRMKMELPVTATCTARFCAVRKGACCVAITMGRLRSDCDPFDYCLDPLSYSRQSTFCCSTGIFELYSSSSRVSTLGHARTACPVARSSSLYRLYPASSSLVRYALGGQFGSFYSRIT